MLNRFLNRNQQNALHSTGPKTPDGKARSAQNARKHGFCSKSPASLPESWQPLYQTHLQLWTDILQPNTPDQSRLVEHIAHRDLLLGQVPIYLIHTEQCLIEEDVELMAKTLNTLATYDQKLARELRALQKAYQHLKEAPPEIQPPPPSPTNQATPEKTPPQPAPQGLDANMARELLQTVFTILEQTQTITNEAQQSLNQLTEMKRQMEQSRFDAELAKSFQPPKKKNPNWIYPDRT